MISNINDFISLAIIIIIVIVLLFIVIRNFVKSRISKQIQEEIDYYKEW